MSDIPTIALLVPVFNGEKFIDKFCRHLMALTVKFDEVIFYNDGSLDNTKTLLAQSGFDYLSSDVNKGVGYSRNILAKAAKSEYIHFHDIDDEFNSSFVQIVVDVVRTNPVDVLFGNADWIDGSTRKTLIHWQYNQQELLRNSLNYFFKNPLGIINTVYNKHKFFSVNGFDEKINCWEDADLHIKLAANSAKFHYVDKVLAYSIRHNEGLSSNQLWCWDCRLQFLERYIEQYKNLVAIDVLEVEVKKVQIVYIKSSQFDKLYKIITLIKKNNLRLSFKKIYIIYLIDKILPSSMVHQLIKKFIKQ